MEFLKKTTIIFFLACIAINAFAQSNQSQIDAFKQSYALEQSGEYKQAADLLKTVLSEDSYETNLRLGWLTYLAGLFDESTAYYNVAIKLMPYSIEARLGAVLPASSQGKWDEVIMHYNKILEIDPNHSVTLYRMGIIYYGKKDYQKAHSYLEKVVNLYPFDGDSLLMFAWCKFQLQDTREAKVLFQKVLLYYPDNESANEGLSLIK